MGRIKAKRVKRDRARGSSAGIPRQPVHERFASVADSMHNGAIADRPEAVRSTIGLLVGTYMDIDKKHPAKGACGGPLLIHLDGSFECHAGCPGATKVVHVPEALQYCEHADLFDLVDPLFHTCADCSHLGSAGDEPPPFTMCPGTELDHGDGTTTCSLGADCAGAEQLHAQGQSCNMFAPCERCGTPALLAL